MTLAIVIGREPGPATSDAVDDGGIDVGDAVDVAVFVDGIGVTVGSTGVKLVIGDAVGVTVFVDGKGVAVDGIGVEDGTGDGVSVCVGRMTGDTVITLPGTAVKVAVFVLLGADVALARTVGVSTGSCVVGTAAITVGDAATMVEVGVAVDALECPIWLTTNAATNSSNKAPIPPPIIGSKRVGCCRPVVGLSGVVTPVPPPAPSPVIGTYVGAAVGGVVGRLPVGVDIAFPGGSDARGWPVNAVLKSPISMPADW